MGKIDDFYSIKNAEDYFKFFDVEYDTTLVNVKRYHIMRKFGEMVKKAESQEINSEDKLLEFFRFALISVYKNFEEGYNPSAADVWQSNGKPSPCASCSSIGNCDDIGNPDGQETNSCSGV